MVDKYYTLHTDYTLYQMNSWKEQKIEGGGDTLFNLFSRLLKRIKADEELKAFALHQLVMI